MIEERIGEVVRVFDYMVGNNGLEPGTVEGSRANWIVAAILTLAAVCMDKKEGGKDE